MALGAVGLSGRSRLAHALSLFFSPLSLCRLLQVRHAQVTLPSALECNSAGTADGPPLIGKTGLALNQ